jgi:hypothetical protein
MCTDNLLEDVQDDQVLTSVRYAAHETSRSSMMEVLRDHTSELQLAVESGRMERLLSA